MAVEFSGIASLFSGWPLFSEIGFNSYTTNPRENYYAVLVEILHIKQQTHAVFYVQNEL